MRSPGVAEIGITLNPKYWGKGYASEVLEGLVKYGFENLSLHRIYGVTRPENIGSVKVLRRIGMKQEAHLRQNVLIRGVQMDSLIFAKLASEM